MSGLGRSPDDVELRIGTTASVLVMKDGRDREAAT
jgi:hypothetical protein